MLFRFIAWLFLAGRALTPRTDWYLCRTEHKTVIKPVIAHKQVTGKPLVIKVCFGEVGKFVAQEYKRIGPVFLQGTFFLLLLASLLFTASHLYSPFFLRKLIGSDDVYQATMKYVDWRVYGFFFSFVAVMFRAFYVGITKTKILTINSVVMVSII